MHSCLIYLDMAKCWDIEKIGKEIEDCDIL